MAANLSLVCELIVPIWKSRPSRGLAICMQKYRRAICMQTHRRALRIHDWACIGGVSDRPRQIKPRVSRHLRNPKAFNELNPPPSVSYNEPQRCMRGWTLHPSLPL